MTEQRKSKVPTEDTCSQIITCREHPPEAEVSTRAEPNHFSVHGAESDSESKQSDWDPERVDDDGPLWYLFHETDRWTQPKQVRCQRGRKVAGRSGKVCEIPSPDGCYYKLESVRFENKGAQNVVHKKNQDDTISREGERTRHRTYHRSRNQIAYSLLPLVNNLDTWRESARIKHQRTTPRHQRRISSWQETLLYSCTTLFPTWRSRVCLNLWTGVHMDSKNEADWDASNDELEQRDDTSKPKHHNFVGLILSPARGLTEATSAAQ